MILILVMMVLSLTACEEQVSTQPSTVVLNPSEPPCWYRICPGKTTKDEALSILSTMPEVEKGSIIDRQFEDPHSFINWRFTPEVAEGSGRFYYRGNIVSYFYFYTQGTLTLGEAVDTFGEPLRVLPFSDCADSRWLYVALLYPDDGVHVVYFEPNWRRGEPAELTHQQPARAVMYYDPALFEDLISRVQGANWLSYSYEDILGILQPWEGFGEISVFETC